MKSPAKTQGFGPWGTLLACLTAVVMVSTGCGEIAENLVEEGVEQAIEADSGEDVELDFNGEDGFRIETDEGSMTMDEDGNFVVEGADGEVVTGEASEDGFTMTNEDGTAVFDVDEDSGVVSAETEDGSFTSGPGVPENWPSSIPEPTDLDDVSGSTISSDDEVIMTITGTVSGDTGEYFESYESSLEGAGFERTNYFESDGFRQGTYSDQQSTVSIASDDGSSNFSVTYVPAAS